MRNYSIHLWLVALVLPVFGYPSAASKQSLLDAVIQYEVPAVLVDATGRSTEGRAVAIGYPLFPLKASLAVGMGVSAVERSSFPVVLTCVGLLLVYGLPTVKHRLTRSSLYFIERSNPRSTLMVDSPEYRHIKLKLGGPLRRRFIDVVSGLTQTLLHYAIAPEVGKAQRLIVYLREDGEVDDVLAAFGEGEFRNIFEYKNSNPLVQNWMRGLW